MRNLAQALEPLIKGDERLILLLDTHPHSWVEVPESLGRIVPLETAVPPFSLQQQWQIPRLLRRLQVDLYHSPYYLMPYWPGVPTLLTVYDLIPQLFPELVSFQARLFSQLGTRLALRTADRLIAISSATRTDFMRAFGIDGRGIDAIPLAPDPRFQPLPEKSLAAVRNKYHLPDTFFLYLGINKPHKNLLRLCRVWQELTTENAATPPLLIAGAWDQRYPQAKQFVTTQEMSTQILFIGPIPDDDLPALYNCARAFLFPSLYEGFGLPVVEAMACGTAVACANRSSLPEIVGNTGVLFNPEDEQEMKHQLQRLITDGAWRQNLAQQGLLRSQQFTWGRTAAATIELYRRFAARE